MPNCRFKVGETVRLSHVASRALGSAARFKILAVLPSNGRLPEYRIRSEQEGYERVVEEGYLEIVSERTV